MDPSGDQFCGRLFLDRLAAESAGEANPGLVPVIVRSLAMSSITRWSGRIVLALLVAVSQSMATSAAWADEKPRPDAEEQQPSEKVSYERDIRPLLAERCALCHGPDEGTREADLRLDDRDDTIRDREGLFVVKPGNPNASELIARLTSRDDDVVMPPPDSGHDRLTPEQIDLVRQWIAQGAIWSRHWAFEPPLRPDQPTVRRTDWINNPIDAFVLSKLEEQGLQPSPAADRITLLRRLSLDLIGLPPTIDEIDSFVADKDSGAYGRLVKRLLASPHCGERWGRVWLDAARYADSDGFEKDKPRTVWFYRDWVINALNRDLPYDQFVIQQIAGDLLPDATQDQIVATGFLRNSMLNEEGGIDPEEFRIQAMFDRMDTVGKAILGFTVQCGQCHSHKYDPFTQHDYYRMFAFLNNSHEAQVSVYTAEQQQQRAEIVRRIAAIEDQLRSERPAWKKQMTQWEDSVRANQPRWTLLPIENAGSTTQRYYRQEDGSLLAQGYAPTKFEPPFSVTTDLPEIRSFRLEMLNHPNLPAGGPGRAIDGQFALTEFKVKATSLNDPDKSIAVQFVATRADFSNPRKQLGPPYTDRDGKNGGFTGPVEYAIDGDATTAWGIDAGPGRRNQPRVAVFVTDRNVAFPEGTRLMFTLSQRHGGWNSDDNQTMNLGRFRVSASADEVKAAPLSVLVRRALEVPLEERTDGETQTVFSYWRRTIPDWKSANDQIEAVWQEHPTATTQLALQERQSLRTTHLLERGDFLKPKDSVTPDVPSFLNPLDEDRSGGRLTFARWLVARESPTAARSIVNRIWQGYFGTGIVDTPEDLGSTGSAPSHPELLDWLAVELMDHSWSLKHIHKLIVLSNTYRQSSQVSAERQQRDPDNRLLARGPRFRVDAEIVRDIFLAASGLLNRKIGGASVYPPAPGFLFERPASYGPKTWASSTGPEKYRRALYTFRFRSVPYPALQAFDAPSGEFATVRRSRSNTPLQALTTLNEPLFFECAQVLARITLAKAGPTDDERLRFAFRRCLTREPTNNETDLLLSLLAKQTERFSNGSLDPTPLLADDKAEGPTLPAGTDAAQLAGWTVVSRVLLNLDETITKE
jgi:hypothetical protein